jgi:group I intron endonuclease
MHNLRLNQHHSKRLQNAWNKYGESSFVFETLHECGEEDLVVNEQKWIDHFDSYNNGYNATPQAGTRRGSVYTHEQRMALSIAHRGVPKSPEHNAAVSAAKQGKSNGPFSEQARANMSIARMGNRNNAHMYIAIDPDGNRHEVDSLPKFCADHDLNYHCMHRVSRGKQASHYGWICHPVKEES